MDNLTQQAEEIEVLKAIFEDAWIYNKKTDSYSIAITKDIELWITLNPDYPSTKPPKYELWAPNLNRFQKDLIDKSFFDIFRENQGGPIIYQWIEKLKDISFKTYTDVKIDTPVDCQDNAKIKVRKNERNSKMLHITHGGIITDRRSSFQGHVCKVTNFDDVREFYNILLENRKIAQANHNILAYRINTTKDTLLQDCDDDGENHAGGRLLHLLQIMDIKNVAVVVTRWYGGILLGPDRFKHINNAARQALSAAGYVSNK